MKILFLTSSLSAGGAERVATTLCNAWSSRGDKVTLIPTFSGGGQPFYKISEAVEVIYLADIVGSKQKKISTYSNRFFALRSLIKKISPDVIISFLSNVNVAAVMSSFKLNIPVVICERTDPTISSMPLLWKIACQLTYRYADALTVQTETVKNKIKYYYFGVKRIRSIPNPLPEEIKSLSLNRDGERRSIVCMGRLDEGKQFGSAIDIFYKVSTLFEQWDLYIYGDGPLKADLDLLIETLDLKGRVFLKGRTSEPWDALASADVFLMTSKYEGFPNVLLEAMGLGLPCATFDCPSGPREMSRNGQDALLVPLGDSGALTQALTRLMSDENLRISLGTRARLSILSRYSLNSVLMQWDSLFKEVGTLS